MCIRDRLNTALYQKMEREQDKYRKWLIQCPPEEILSHAYEYVVREDILMSMEELNLPDDQAIALLKQRGPLDDVFKDFSKLETDYMETVRSAIAVSYTHLEVYKRQTLSTAVCFMQ